jgi:hypothetical protein
MIRVTVKNTDGTPRASGDFPNMEDAKVWVDKCLTEAVWGKDPVVEYSDVTSEYEKRTRDKDDLALAKSQARQAIAQIDAATSVADLKPVLKNIVKFIVLSS